MPLAAELLGSPAGLAHVRGRGVEQQPRRRPVRRQGGPDLDDRGAARTRSPSRRPRRIRCRRANAPTSMATPCPCAMTRAPALPLGCGCCGAAARRPTWYEDADVLIGPVLDQLRRGEPLAGSRARAGQAEAADRARPPSCRRRGGAARGRQAVRGEQHLCECARRGRMGEGEHPQPAPDQASRRDPRIGPAPDVSPRAMAIATFDLKRALLAEALGEAGPMPSDVHARVQGARCAIRHARSRARDR